MHQVRANHHRVSVPAPVGGLFLALAGSLHVSRGHRTTEENVAMVSDLAIGALMLTYVVWTWT